MKTLKHLLTKAPVFMSAFFVMTAMVHFGGPCSFLWGQPKLPEIMRKKH
jgi:cyclic lactone autoinducer peptide